MEEKHSKGGPTGSGFDNLGIAPALIKVLAAAKFQNPTPIQEKAIPVGLTGQDIVGIAQTGTGKTIAFSIPMLQRLSREKGQGVVVLPTRELALQVDEELQKLAKQFGLRTAVLIGGASMNVQRDQIRRKPHVVVATPGRLIDHLERGWIKLDQVHTLVLDEADRMLDMGFMPQINKILKAVPEKRQTMLFSATMPEEIERLARRFMKDPERIEVARAGTASDNVEQAVYVVLKKDKMKLLRYLLREEKGTVLVFSRTKFGAKRIARDLVRAGESAADIHSNKTLAQRRAALDGFKSGKHRVLVATDIAARGIDVTGISLVINYDLPDQAEDYVHRIGRTGRAEMKGRAVSFAEPDQGALMNEIQYLTQQYLQALPLPFEPSEPMPTVKPSDNKKKPKSGPPRRGGRRPAGRGPRKGAAGGRRRR